jgi:hypothetical protein
MSYFLIEEVVVRPHHRSTRDHSPAHPTGTAARTMVFTGGLVYPPNIMDID